MNPRAPVSTADRIEAEACAWIARQDAGLSPAERSELERWRSADPRHAEALHRFGATWSALGRPRRTGSSAVLATELRTLGRRRRNRRFGVTAGLAALALLAGVTWWPRSRPGGAGQPGVARAILLVPERRTLADGSVLEFPAGAKFAIDFGSHVRRVVLERGAAHFEIARDPARPFIVAAAGIEVRAIGTAFAVHLDPQAVEVLVTEGHVEVTTDADRDAVVGRQAPSGAAIPARGAAAATPRPAPAVIPVDSGNRIVMARSVTPATAPAPAVHKVEDAEIARRLAWRSPRVEFSGAPLTEVVALLNRYHAVQFVIADPALESVPLSGLFRASDTAAFLRILEVSFEVKSEQRGNQIILRKAR